MKAKVNATGKIIDVFQVNDIITSRGIESQYVDKTDYTHYLRSEIEFIKEEPQKNIDWEERRYEVAKRVFPVLCGIKSRIHTPYSYNDLTNEYYDEYLNIEKTAEYAVKYADVLIAELKKGGNNEKH